MFIIDKKDFLQSLVVVDRISAAICYVEYVRFLKFEQNYIFQHL